MFGGTVNLNGRNITFNNTCTLDTWFSILKVTFNEYPRFYTQLCDESCDQNKEMLCLLNDAKYDAAKHHVAIARSLPEKNDILNFYGDEHIFINTYLGPVMKHCITSNCNSPNCPAPNKTLIHTEFPAVDFQNYKETDWIPPEVFTEQIIQWFKSANTSRCGESLKCETNHSEWTFWDENITKGYSINFVLNLFMQPEIRASQHCTFESKFTHN